MNGSFVPKTLKFQWHITERCTWSCKHCYQEGSAVPDLRLEQLFYIFDQFLFLVKKWQLPPDRVSLSITGGEPLIREDIFQLLERISKFSPSHFNHWSLLSNGSLLTEENLKRLKELGIASYQVSLEGKEKRNDEIRGKGAFKKTIAAIKLLRKANIPFLISFTLTKKNIGDISYLVKLCEKLGARVLNVRRLIPWGRGKELKDYLLEPRELKEFYFNIKKISKNLLDRKSKLRLITGCESGIFNEELLIDPLPNMLSNFCGIIQGRFLHIMANGDILPCRRLPIVVGNALKDSIYDVYYSKQMQDFRNLDKLHPFCQKCSNFYNCFGGAKCVTCGYTGKWDIPDVQCWRAYKKLGEPNF